MSTISAKSISVALILSMTSGAISAHADEYRQDARPHEKDFDNSAVIGATGLLIGSLISDQVRPYWLVGFYSPNDGLCGDRPWSVFSQ